MLKLNVVKGAGIGLALLLAAAAPGRAADLGAKDEPIKLAMLEWTGAHVSTHIAGQLLEKLGYKVEYVTAGNFPQFSGLADGTLSASVEIWLNNVGDIYPKVLAEKKIEDIGRLDLETREGWIYPKFMEQVCPGLPDWTALEKPDCVQALSTPETAPNGRFLDYPGRLGFARRDDSRRQFDALHRRAGGLGGRAGGRAAIRRRRQDAAGHDVLGSALRAGRDRGRLDKDAALQGADQRALHHAARRRQDRLVRFRREMAGRAGVPESLQDGRRQSSRR